jgi:pimeloyl-ACP methyl ester carboxylesterase
VDEGSALITDAALLGLRRVVVDTSTGPVAVRVGAEAKGPATILLHGAAGSWTTWTPLLAEAVRSGRPLPDLVLLDLPGWGETALPPRGTDVPAMSRAVESVAESLGYRRWTVIGHSLGGFLALDLAARRPDATLGVGLVSGTGAAVIDAVRRPVRGGLRLPWFAGMLLAMRALALLGPAGRVLVRLLHAVRLLGPLGAPLFADRRTVDPSVTAALAEEVRPAAFTRAARAAGGYDLDSWRTITCPVRSVVGHRDVFVGAGDAAAFAARIADFQEVRVDGAGHFAAVERPAAVLDALAALTARGARGSPSLSSGGDP